MEYKIDHEFLDILYYYVISCDDGSPSYKDDIDGIEQLLYRLKNDFKQMHPKITPMSLFRGNIKEYDDYAKYYPYVRSFVKSYLAFTKYYTPHYKELTISDDDAIELSRMFFHDQGSFFIGALDKYLLDDVEDHLEFFTPNENTDGEMYFVSSTDDCFVLSPDKKDFTKVCILVHEFEHVIDCLNNPKFYTNRIIRECATMFMELISTDYLKPVLDLNGDGDQRKMHIHSINKFGAYHIFNKNQLLYLGRKYNNLNSNGLRRMVKRYGYTDNDINRLNDDVLMNDYYYQISYLIALELYHLYQEDKEYTLYILKDIIMNGTDDNIFDMLKKYNIVLNSHLIDYEEGLCLKLHI